MGFPCRLSFSLIRYLIKSRLEGRKRFPMVLMLEPLFRCNLACAGCGRIREYRDVLDRMLSAEECLAAVHEAGAPVVSITGGEPLLQPDIGQIVAGITAEKRFVHLCTNGLLLEKSLSKFKSSPYLSFVFHLDSLAESHDRFAGREGVFKAAVRGAGVAKKAGFQVLVNTTIYKWTSLDEIKQLFSLLSNIPVDGIMMAPAFNYQAVDGDEFFLSREEAVSAFQPIYELRKKFHFYNTPIYFEFLAGKRDLVCIPWSSPTRNPKGWKRPCYFITDGHCHSFQELMNGTQWENYGVGNDLRCSNCMVHCGFEASAIKETFRGLPNMWQTLKWSFSKG